MSQKMTVPILQDSLSPWLGVRKQLTTLGLPMWQVTVAASRT